MEKLGHWVALAKKCEEHFKEEKKFKKSFCIFTYNLTLGQFSVPACETEPTCFSVSGSSTPNGLFQTIN